jgi:hypothetical protein
MIHTDPLANEICEVLAAQLKATACKNARNSLESRLETVQLHLRDCSECAGSQALRKIAEKLVASAHLLGLSRQAC